jgi:hypothetical protein
LTPQYRNGSVWARLAPLRSAIRDALRDMTRGGWV